MMQTERSLLGRNIPIHPILAGLFPVFSMIANNTGELVYSDTLRAIVVSILLTILIWGISYLILRDLQRSALITTFLLVLFFSYGHIYTAVEGNEFSDLQLGRHRFLFPLFLVVGIFGLVMLRKVRGSVEVTRSLNWITAAVLLLPVGQIIIAEFQSGSTPEPRGEEIGLPVDFPEIVDPVPEELPDIYYIVLDEYARGDTLLDVYGLDNEPFLQNLEELGMYVARCSQSNYPRTRPSMASSLNFNYVEELGYSVDPDSADMSWLGELVEYSDTRQVLESLGYTFVAFETGVPWADLTSADLFLAPPSDPDTEQGLLSGLNDFEVLFLRSTLGQLLLDAASLFPEVFAPDLEYSNRVHRDRVLFVFDELEKLPDMQGPKLVHAHILSPHLPIVFGPNGEEIPRQPRTYEEQLTGYRNQVIYLNHRLERVIEAIIEKSDPPPIIILQGDHGPRRIEGPETNIHRLRILNAYYYPSGNYSELSASITPVNTFRTLFNELLKTDFEMLADVSYWSERKSPFQYETVPNACLESLRE